MKKYILILLVLLSFEVTASIIVTDSIITSIGVLPEFPIENEVITLSVFGSIPPTVGLLGLDFDVQANEIVLNLFYTGIDEALPTTFPVDPYRIDLSIGVLSAGTYSVIANAYDNGVVYETISDSFVVSAAVPLPGAYLLYGSSMFAFFFIKLLATNLIY